MPTYKVTKDRITIYKALDIYWRNYYIDRGYSIILQR